MSDWKEGAIKRRDERHTKVSDEPRKSLTPGKKKKDTKKWCRGKEGTAHKTECRIYSETKNADRRVFGKWRVLVCTVCGKELEHYYGRSKNKPEWIDK